MARYIDAEKLCKDLMDMARYQPIDKQSTIVGIVSTIKHFPTADVAPRAEVAREIFEELIKEANLRFDGFRNTIVFPLEYYCELTKKYTEVLK